MATFAQTITVNGNATRANSGMFVDNRVTSYATFSTTGGMRFTSVPKALTIASATLNIYITHADIAGYLLISGEDADNPSAITSYADQEARVRTTASNNSVYVGTVAVDWYAIDVKSIAEEIQARAGFATGNSMIFLLDHNGGNLDCQEAVANARINLEMTYTPIIRNNIMIF